RAVTAERRMMVDVLAELDDAQRVLLVERFPRLLERPWYTTIEPGRKGPGTRRRSAVDRSPTDQ
ncbi:MAG: hypothetical protein AAGD38_04380, partial [Acidobacteriota bacterium]